MSFYKCFTESWQDGSGERKSEIKICQPGFTLEAGFEELAVLQQKAYFSLNMLMVSILLLLA